MEKMSDSNPEMKRAIEGQMTTVRSDLKKRLRYFMEEFDLPLELVASVTVTLGFDMLHGGEGPLWEGDDDEVP